MDQRNRHYCLSVISCFSVINYYFGFMIVVFLPTILHERLQTGNDINPNRCVFYYFFLAGGASMIMVLPAVLDLQPMVKLFLKLQP